MNCPECNTELEFIYGDFETGVAAPDGYRESVYEEGFYCAKCAATYDESELTQTAFNRDNVLTPDDRLASARKCLDLLASETDSMGEKESAFVDDMQNKIDQYGVSERQLAWLRDLVSKYTT
jgi:hypothetical protein